MPAVAVRSDVRPEEESLDCYRREVERFALLTADEERQLLYDVRDGVPGALEDLVNANLRLVMFIAKRYRNMGVPFADLVNEGNIGLIEAGQRFDSTRGNSFASYAFYWVRQAIRKALMDHRATIRIPVYRQNRLRKVIKEQRQETGLTDRVLSDTEREFPESRFRMVSLTAPESGHDGRPVSDMIADESIDHPLEGLAKQTLRGHVRRAMEVLSERQMRVLCLYYGLGGNRCHTLAEIGVCYGVTKEYIRQIRNAALDRLRRGDVDSVLSSYID